MGFIPVLRGISLQGVWHACSALHPCPCGAAGRVPPSLARSSGSPPRVRGGRRSPQRALELDGSIPAHAARFCAYWPVPDLSRDHPRACGVVLLAPGAPTGKLGWLPRVRGPPRVPRGPTAPAGCNPPCARGIRRAVRRPGRANGPTPAWAGPLAMRRLRGRDLSGVCAGAQTCRHRVPWAVEH